MTGRWRKGAVSSGRLGSTDVTASEVTTLEHEVGNDAVEGRALVTEALLAGAESTEVLGGLGDDVVVQLEVDAAGLNCWTGGGSVADPN